jgi:hypothetical protein
MQAACDAECRFTFFAMAAPGVTADRDAIKDCDLDALINALPQGFVTIGDAAYTPTERMVAMFFGSDRSTPKYDNFNFYASQCRIRIEMAFGLMQIKWGILQRPISCKLSNLKWMVMAIARLHNFVVDERLTSSLDAPQERSYIPSQPEDEDGDPIELQSSSIRFPGLSFVRERMVERVARLKLSRPAGNRIVRE